MRIADAHFMAPHNARHTVLSEIAPFAKDGDELMVVVETPKGSRNKYDYDPQCDCIQLATVLPEGMVFPFDFGFIPSTLGDDGDPLDVLILLDEPVVPGRSWSAPSKPNKRRRARTGRAMIA